MRIHRLPALLALLLLRLLPRVLHNPEAAAARRVASLDEQQRRELARNLSRMLRPKLAA